jgi:hypothetical protein
MVAILTEEQKIQLDGREFRPYSYFNPIQDSIGNWIISLEEINECTDPELEWVKSLPLIEFQ